MREAALRWRQYLAKEYREIELRFDIIEVILEPQKIPEVHHMAAAFGLKEGELRPLSLGAEKHSPSLNPNSL